MFYFQILDWLSHSPTDIESYIRPGCIVLTIYLRLGKPTWEEVCCYIVPERVIWWFLFRERTTSFSNCFCLQLCCDLGSSLRRLLEGSDDSFWRTGWLYARVQHSVAFIYNGLLSLSVSLNLSVYLSTHVRGGWKSFKEIPFHVELGKLRILLWYCKYKTTFCSFLHLCCRSGCFRHTFTS